MKKIAIIIGVIVLIVIGLSWNKFGGPGEGPIKTFMVDGGSFVAAAQDAEKIDVHAVVEGKSRKDSVLLGTMELVEKNNSGEQTWVLQVPPIKSDYTEVYALALNAAGKTVGMFNLPQQTKEDLANTLWPAPKSQTIYGLVREMSGNTLRLSNGGPRTMDIVITLTPETKLFDDKDKAMTRARLIKNTGIAVTGYFVDEQSFLAQTIELYKLGT